MLVKPTLITLLFAGAAVAAPSWNAGRADVRVICPMTTGGSFDASTSALGGTLTPGAGASSALEGSPVVDLRTLDTGIGLRNEHLRETYLEIDKGPGFDQAMVTDINLKDLNPAAPQGKGSFTGSLTLHGVTKPIAGGVDVRSSGGGLQVRASFPLNLSDYGIREPRYLGIGVRNTVQIEATFAVTH